MNKSIQEIEDEITTTKSLLKEAGDKHNKLMMILIPTMAFFLLGSIICVSAKSNAMTLVGGSISILSFLTGMTIASKIKVKGADKQKVELDKKLQLLILEARKARAREASSERKESLPVPQASSKFNGSDEKTCPMCAETIKAAAKICKHCKHVLS